MNSLLCLYWKSLIFIFFIILFVLFSPKSHSQPCLPDGIELTTQSQVDSFAILYPDCTEILGDVMIHGADIQNLYGLSKISQVDGTLYISFCDLLQSMRGLDSLTYVGHDLEIGFNDDLQELSGLENLDSVGGDLKVVYNCRISDMEGLTRFSKVGDLIRICENDSLVSLSGMDNFSYANAVMIYDNPQLISLNALNRLTSVYLLYIEDNYSLQHLTGLESMNEITGILQIEGNISLLSLQALENLTKVGEHFLLFWNHSLLDLHGLHNLEEIGDLSINGNDVLIDISSLSKVTSVRGEIYITDNVSLQTLTGLDYIKPDSIDKIYIVNNPALTLCNVNSICEYLALPGAEYTIGGNGSGCSDSEELLEACGITGDTEYGIVEGFTVKPNPVINQVNVEYFLKELCKVQIRVYNTYGQEVDCIIRNDQYAGNHSFVLNMTGYPDGFYFIRLDAGKWFYSMKVNKAASR